MNFKRLNDLAKVPTRADDGAAGYDLYAATSYRIEIPPHKTVKIGTGIAMEIPEGYVGLVFPRSSNRKTEAYMCNHVGVIDSGYRGEIMVTFKNRDKDGSLQPYKVGNRVAQIIIMPYSQIEFVESNELSETERGSGGHGSTGV